ncbi:MAG: ATP-binding cassette domain-containing protein [Thermoplasmatota archaeon]
MTIEPGEYVALVGANGSGKTTLLHTLAGYLKPDGGSILIDAQPAALLPPEKRAIAVVFAEPTLFRHMTVEQNVAFQPRGGRPSDQLRSAVIQALSIEGILTRRPASLSLGESRRVDLARALLSRAGALLLDEPYASLPSNERANVAGSVKRVCAELGTSVLHVTHDTLPEGLAERVLRLVEGRMMHER